MTADAYGIAWTIAASGIALVVSLAVFFGRLTDEVKKLRHSVEVIENLLREKR